MLKTISEFAVGVAKFIYTSLYIKLLTKIKHKNTVIVIKQGADMSNLL